jgi:hypothetical protein
MHLDDVDNSLQEVLNHATVHCKQEVRLRVVANDPGNTFTPILTLVNPAGQVFCIGCIRVGISECGM